ncbi:MAG: ABC transporter substrate-binding protein [Treponema sp.]|nr:ABC transporter substrate-binding protein [Treponema sp.]MDY3756027.1 ABC transporter substrate-binding protein [Treponema sp.]
MKGKAIRLSWLVLGFLLLGGILVSCKKAPTQEPPVEIKFMHGWGGNGTDHIAMRDIFEGFQQLHPQVKVVVDSAPDISVVIDKACDMLAVDRMPDIISTNGRGIYVANATAKGTALNLTPHILNDQELYNSVPQALLSQIKNNQPLYSIPDVLEVQALWYNRSILEEAGLLQPGESLPTDWDDFMVLCQRLVEWSQQTGRQIMPFALDQQRYLTIFMALLASRGGEPYLRQLSQGYLDGGMIQSLELLRDLSRFSWPDHFPLGINDGRQAFVDGRSVFFLNGVWDNMVFAGTDLEKDIGYSPYPGLNGVTVSYVSLSEGYVISSMASQTQQSVCLDFLKYILSEEVQTRIVEETLQVPLNPAVKVELIREAHPLLGMALEEAYKAQVQVPTVYSLWHESVIESFHANIASFLEGKISAKEMALLMDKARILL